MAAVVRSRRRTRGRGEFVSLASLTRGVCEFDCSARVSRQVLAVHDVDDAPSEADAPPAPARGLISPARNQHGYCRAGTRTLATGPPARLTFRSSSSR